MNIYIISQYLDSKEKGDDHLFNLGRELGSRGHFVTALTSSGAVDFELGKKKIGLFKDGGLNVIAFNVPYKKEMSGLKKMLAHLKFARLSAEQGRNLPRPDLILARVPPLTAAWPALKLSERFEAPLVVEVEELWPDALIARGELKNRLVIRALKGLEEKTYAGAGRIITSDQKLARIIKERAGNADKVEVLEDSSDETALLAGYEQAIKKLSLDLNRVKNSAK